MGNRRALAALSTWIALATASVAVTDAVAAPYEIAAAWKERTGATWPDGVAGAFRGIEHVSGLGVVAYSDDALLRVSNDEPFVTLGVRPSAGADGAFAYVGMAPLGANERLFVRTQARRDGDTLHRESHIVRLRAEERSESSLPFPPPSSGASWSVIRLIRRSDGSFVAYAGRGEPLPFPLRLDRVSRAVEQRFFRSTDPEVWAALPALAPEQLSATAACALGDTLLVAGTHLALARDGKVARRRAASAVLDGEKWNPLDIETATPEAVSEVDAIACADGSAYLLTVMAGPGQDHHATFLSGPRALHRYVEGAWRKMELPATLASAPGARITALALDATGEPWIAAGSDLHRHHDGRWSVAAATGASLPSGAVIEGIAFDDAGTGWAVANSPGDADEPKARGFLVRFDAATRELRGITWSPLRQRGFGLFGATE